MNNQHIKFSSLSDKNEIALLFNKGKSINIYPIKILSHEKIIKLFI